MSAGRARLTVFACLMLLIVPLSLALATPPATSTNVPAADQQSFKTALAEAFRPPLLRASRARIFHLWISACLRDRASARLSGRSRHPGADRRPGGCRDQALQYHGLAERRLAAEPSAQALHPVGALCRACVVDPWASSRCRSRRSPAIVFGAATGLTWLSTVPPTSALVALMFSTLDFRNALRLCLRQPSGRRLPRRVARQRAVRRVRLLHLWSGGFRFCSACCPPSSTCRRCRKAGGTRHCTGRS